MTVWTSEQKDDERSRVIASALEAAKITEMTVGRRSAWRRLNHAHPWMKVVVMSGVVVMLAGLLAMINIRKAERAGEVMSVMEVGATENEKQAEPQMIPDEDYTDKKLVALTFDDGPYEEATPRLLDVLQEKQAVATFFVVGNRLAGNGEIMQRAEKEGHEVESHSLGHANLAQMNEAALVGDVEATAEIFRQQLGHEPRMLRPPYGAVSDLMRARVAIPLMVWSVDTRDWETQDAGVIRENARRDAFDGSVILMHDIYTATVDAVAGIIDDLRADGYALVTVSKLAELRHETLTTGVLYGKFLPE